MRYTTAIRRSASGLSLLIGLAVLGSCGIFPYHPDPDVYSPDQNVFYHDLSDVNPDRTVRHTIDVGSTPRDVYLVFTNSASTSIDPPTVDARTVAGPVPEPEPSYASPAARSLAAAGAAGPVALRDHPDLADWQPPRPGDPPARALAPTEPNLAAVPNADKFDDDGTLEPGEYRVWSVNYTTVHDFYFDQRSFDIDDPIRSVLALRRPDVSTVHGPKTLEIWVEEGEWDPSDSLLSTRLTPARVEALADAFMIESDSDAGNDVYDWVSAVYGEEWSDTAGSYSNTIADQDTITVLLYNIGSDGPGGIVGFFWSKDNFLRSNVGFSNERVMFYLDSESYAARLNGETSWSIDNYWPNEIVSTLAHELQHMINFHERYVLRDAITETWMNEMLSLVAEDLVEEKRNRRGPRGVDPAAFPSGSAGEPGISEGRLPLYNTANDISLTGWDTSGDVLESYSITYSFGAFLGRNFGGARLFHEIGRNRSSMPDNVLSESIVAAGGPAGMTLRQLLWRWGAAAILSDGPRDAGVRLNPGTWMTSTAGGVDFRLGSINLYHYVDPPFYETGSISATSMPPSSKLLYRLGNDLTGTIDVDIEFESGMDFAVVIR